MQQHDAFEIRRTKGLYLKQCLAQKQLYSYRLFRPWNNEAELKRVQSIRLILALSSD